MTYARAPGHRTWLPLATGLLCHAVAAQTPIDYNPTSRTDVYGNARAVYTTGFYTNLYEAGARRRPVPRYGVQDRRRATGGGLGVFARRGYIPATRRGRSVGRSTYPLLKMPSSPWQRQGLERGGAFGLRGADTFTGNASAALRRRYLLLRSTAFNAPVYRALLRSGAGIGPGPAVRHTTLAASEIEPPGPPIPAQTLGQRLRARVDDAGRRTRVEAWRWFREENYHRAARAFENAALARPDDTEARIGELFCHLSVGAIRTAVAVLGELTRRDTNPFTHPLDMTGAYGDPRRAREMRIRLQLRAAAGGHKNPAITALLALVLWYSGEHDEALSFATTLARDFPDDVYASWAPKMRQADRDTRDAEERRP